MGTLTKENKTILIKWIITAIVLLLIYMIPTTELYTPVMRTYLILTIFFVMAFAFSLFDTTYIALAIPILYITFNIATPQVAFTGWTQSTVWMMLGAIILGDIVAQTGLLKRISFWFVVKFGGKSSGIIWGMLLCGIILAYVAPNAGAALFFVLAYIVCQSLGIKQYSAMAVVLFYTAHIAGNAAPILLTYDTMFDAAMALCQTAYHDMNFNITYVTYAFHNIIHLPLVFLLCYIPYRVWGIHKEKDDTENIVKELNSMGPITKDEKKATGLLILLMVLFLTQSITGWGVYLCFMITVLISFLPGINLGNSEILKNADYKIPIFIAGCLSIGIVGNKIGIGTLISSLLMPLMGDGIAQTSTVAFIFGYIVNILLTPMAGVSILTLPLAQHVIDMGMYPLPILYMMINGLNNTLFPYESAAYVLLFSFNMITMKQFMQIFTLRTIITFIYTMVVSIPYWYMIGLFDGLVTFF